MEQLDTAPYEEFTELVVLRDNVLQELQQKPDMSEDEKHMLRQIGEFDSVILNRMLELKEEAAQAIQKLSKTRVQKKAYQDSYTPGSFFFDRKE
ncbi:hypothetical protein [Paenibacillus tarimensis]|uniref:hypothetical protein n=1 Tax=Paenibacillus tarimensis TaxID=416012 RepID=UPI001F2B2EC8|nr:hypothetical protein [Paenibacillus tarimensis]MCF2944120.1 hypothetical protein [Paenibacillus tarimensis]